MGHSPKASVYFGHDLAHTPYHATPAWWDTTDDVDQAWRVELATRLGWVPIQRPARGEHRSYLEFTNTAAYQHYSANNARRDKPVAATGVQLQAYGHDDEPAWALQITASVHSVADYASTPLPTLDTDPAWPAKLTEVAVHLGLTLPADTAAGWHLNCSHPS